MATFELVGPEWKAGERRVAGVAPGERIAVDRVVGALVAELRRRLGGPFTVDELVALYDAGTDWCMQTAYAIAPSAPAAWDPRTTTDAAFGRYVREARDYAGGRQILGDD